MSALVLLSATRNCYERNSNCKRPSSHCDRIVAFLACMSGGLRRVPAKRFKKQEGPTLFQGNFKKTGGEDESDDFMTRELMNCDEFLTRKSVLFTR